MRDNGLNRRTRLAASLARRVTQGRASQARPLNGESHVGCAPGGVSPTPSYNRPPVASPMNGPLPKAMEAQDLRLHGGGALPDGRVLRLLDANANRAREALRVIEDYARFVLDDRDTSAELKAIRHEFAAATETFVADAILHRDTPGDVGTGTKVETELRREGVTEVVVAAGKRLGEALRAIEEFLKTTSPADAAKVECLRYRFYDVEHRLAFSLRPTAAAGGFATGFPTG